MTTYDDIILRDGPKLYLPLDDTSGTTATALAGSNGTYSGSPTLGVAGPTPVGSTAVALDGVDDRVSTPSEAHSRYATPPFTYEVWFKRNGTPASSEWVYWQGNDSVTNPMFGFYCHPSWPNRIAIIARQSDGTTRINNVQNTSDVLDNEWHHLVYTEDASRNGILYIDGEQETTVAAYSVTTTDMTGRSRLGRREGGTVDGEWEGGVAAFATYDYALSATQVAQHYAAGPPAMRTFLGAHAKDLGAVLYLPLDDKGGTTAVAEVGSNGTYSGGPTMRAAGPSDVVPYGISTDGTDDKATITVSELGASQPQTWEAWVNVAEDISSATPTRHLFGSAALGLPMVFGTYEGASVVLIRVPPDWNYTYWTGFTIPAGWHHHVVTYNGTRHGWAYYLDGVATGTKTALASGAYGLASGTYVVGSSGGATYDDFAGVAGVAIYNRALTAAEVHERYVLGLSLRAAHADSPIRF